MEQDKLQKAFSFRHACKEFDKDKKVSSEDLNYILEAGRLAPSSFGLEHWKFVVFSSQEDKNEIEKMSFHQKQMSTASQIIVVLSKNGEFHENSEYIKNILFSRIPEPKNKIVFDKMNQRMKSMSETEVRHYCENQCFIAMTQMMIASAFKGVDSCPIGGFENDKILDHFDIDKGKYSIAVILPIGYRKSPPKREKARLDFDEVVEFR